jgi:hypothetical protein
MQLDMLRVQKEQAEKRTAALSHVMVYSSNKANDHINSLESALAQSSLHANMLRTLNMELVKELKVQLRITEAGSVKAQERQKRLRHAEELIPILVARMSPVSLYIIANISLEINELSKKHHDDKKAKEMQNEPQEPLQATNDEHANSSDEVSFYLFLYHTCHLVC